MGWEWTFFINVPVGVVALIIAGLVVLGLFVAWQAVNKSEPLVPLALFRDRDFSLANLVIAAMRLTVTALALPLVYFFQLARGLTPTQSALMLAPMGVLLGVLSTDISLGWLLLPSALLGIANAGIWGPVTTAATRHLPPHQAGAGAGVYNATRQLGSA